MNASQDTRVYLLGMTTSELKALVESLGQPRYRGRQIAAWLYRRNVPTIDAMSDLPAGFRAKLHTNAMLCRAKPIAATQAPDGTTKFLLEMEDGQRIEAVLLPYEERVSACVSTQVGCAAGCAFCASALDGLVRNLTAGEIVDQVLTLQRHSPRRISHVVYMGMGEPLLNYDNVIKSIRILNDEVGIGMRHITVSTVGIAPRIEKLAEEGLQLTLAVSLHASNDAVRRSIIPVAERYPLRELMAALRRYADLTHRRITFEYLLIRGVNDSSAMAHELASLLKGMLCNVNVIPYNAVEGLELNRPSTSGMKTFRSVLERSGVVVTQRLERGHTIAGACGQLRRRVRR